MLHKRCVFVSVDIQEGMRPEPVQDGELPALWRRLGFQAGDVNAANAHAWDVALPNALAVAEACRGAGMPRVFIHWGYLFEDGMDLDPETRRTMLENHGADCSEWAGHIAQPGSRPAAAFDIQPGDYVLPKAGQDAFASCNLDFVLRNLGAECLLMVGGHTGACFGKTAASARKRGYTVVCIEDATTDARESTRRAHIEQAGCDYVVSTAELLASMRRAGEEKETHK